MCEARSSLVCKWPRLTSHGRFKLRHEITPDGPIRKNKVFVSFGSSVNSGAAVKEPLIQLLELLVRGVSGEGQVCARASNVLLSLTAEDVVKEFTKL